MFLNPTHVPEIRLNRIPWRESRGSLHTSMSHVTSVSPLESPWMQRRRYFSFCSKSQWCFSKTRRISLIISAGSIELVVFMLQVNRSERGFTGAGPPRSPTLAALLLLRLAWGTLFERSVSSLVDPSIVVSSWASGWADARPKNLLRH